MYKEIAYISISFYQKQISMNYILHALIHLKQLHIHEKNIVHEEII